MKRDCMEFRRSSRWLLLSGPLASCRVAVEGAGALAVLVMFPLPPPAPKPMSSALYVQLENLWQSKSTLEMAAADLPLP